MKARLLPLIVVSTAAFCPHQPHIHPLKIIHKPTKTTLLHLTTEEDVIALVEKAETLWAEALQARKTANELSEQAETLADDAVTSATEANASLQQSVSISKIGEAQNAQSKSLDLGALLQRVEEAQFKADEIEMRAEEALRESEAALEQHLIDFPENA